MGVGTFSGSRGKWPMSDNDIFKGVQTPEDTIHNNNTNNNIIVDKYIFDSLVYRQLRTKTYNSHGLTGYPINGLS